jgi:hypothetical protein
MTDEAKTEAKPAAADAVERSQRSRRTKWRG